MSHDYSTINIIPVLLLFIIIIVAERSSEAVQVKFTVYEGLVAGCSILNNHFLFCAMQVFNTSLWRNHINLFTG